MTPLTQQQQQLDRSRPRGPLVIIGGHEDKHAGKEILSRFTELSGGANAEIAVMTCASKKPSKAGNEYKKVFEGLGVRRAQVVHVADPSRAANAEVLNPLMSASGVFFVGGEPIRILEAIQDTPVASMLHQRHERGLVIGGTSAGALMMPDVVILNGDSATHPAENTIEAGRGMGFVSGLLLDVHYAERGRCGRMLSAIAKFPRYLGLGIDEDTALVLQDGSFEVLGSGSVFIFDARTSNYQDLTPEEREDLALTGVQLHVLPRGFRFDLESRTLAQPALRSAS